MTQTTVESELEAAVGALGDEPAPDTDTEDEGSGGDAYARLETRLNKRMDEAMTKRREVFAKSLEKFEAKWRERVQARLDEFALSGRGGAVQNPELVRQSLARQIETHQSRLAALQEQLAKLGQSEPTPEG